MAKRSSSLSDRFPHLKLFFFLAVLIAFPLTVWSVQKAPTNTEQEAASATGNLEVSIVNGANRYIAIPQGRVDIASASARSVVYGSIAPPAQRWGGILKSGIYGIVVVNTPSYYDISLAGCINCKKPTNFSKMVPIIPISYFIPVQAGKTTQVLIKYVASSCASKGGFCATSALCTAEGTGTITGVISCGSGRICCKP